MNRHSTLEYFATVDPKRLQGILDKALEMAEAGDRDAIKLVAPILVPTRPVEIVELGDIDLRTMRGIIKANERVVRRYAEGAIGADTQRALLDGLRFLSESLDGGKLEEQIEDLTSRLEAIGGIGASGSNVVPLKADG